MRFLTGVPDGPRRLEVFRAPVSDEAYLALWRKTFRADSRFLTNVSLFRLETARKMTFARGEVRIDDLHTRTRIPIAGERPAKLAELFDVDEEILRRALSMTGDPEPESSDARITAYLSVAATPEAAFEPLATPDGYRQLLEGVAEVAGEDWHFRLSPPGAPQAGFEEEVTPDPESRALAIRRRYADGREISLSFRVEEREGVTYLVREAVLSGAREDLLKNDSARGRLAGTLAVDLLAWTRRIR